MFIVHGRILGRVVWRPLKKHIGPLHDNIHVVVNTVEPLCIDAEIIYCCGLRIVKQSHVECRGGGKL